MKKYLLVLILMAGLAGPGLAVPALADFKAGVEAANKGAWATAVREFTPLAEQGDSAAQFNLGLIYANGRGVAKNDIQALIWYSKAAHQIHARAQANLAFMYATGRAVPQDLITAYMWASLAMTHAKGSTREAAAKFRATLAAAMTPDNVTAAERRVMSWKPNN